MSSSRKKLRHVSLLLSSIIEVRYLNATQRLNGERASGSQPQRRTDLQLQQLRQAVFLTSVSLHSASTSGPMSSDFADNRLQLGVPPRPQLTFKLPAIFAYEYRTQCPQPRRDSPSNCSPSSVYRRNFIHTRHHSWSKVHFLASHPLLESSNPHHHSLKILLWNRAGVLSLCL